MSPNLARAGCLAGLALLYLLCLRAYYVGFFNDDAFYLLGARSLLSGGFRELSAPGAPPMTIYMPGYPLVLAQWSWLAGSSPLAAQLLSVALTTAAMGLMWACFASELPPAAAFAAVAVTAFNPLTASISGTVLSDIPFLVMTLLVFLAARPIWEKGSDRAWAGLGAMTGAAFLIRPTGAALTLALVLSLLGERRWGRAAWAAAGAALVAAPWLGRNALIGGSALPYAAQLAAPWSASSAFSDFLIRLARNAGFYGPELFGRTWFRWPAAPGLQALRWATVLLGLAALAVGLREWGGRGWRKLLSVYLLLYAALHLGLHLQSGRYIFTALPMAAPLFFLGLSAVDRRLRMRDRLVLGAAALSLALSLAPVANVVRTSLWRHTPLNTPPLKTLAWIQGATSPADVFAADLDGRWFLLTGRQTVRLRKLYEPGAFAAWLKAARVDYVLTEPNEHFMTTASGGTTHDPMPLDRLRDLLSGGRRVFADAEERTEIYRVGSAADEMVPAPTTTSP
ncbi:MAG: glycosyltransferase family 39 protein [Elusimicrobia bacterium]|nr:glycosyltransferase family 39 protein [Elusimicrobiota bacterium]